MSIEAMNWAFNAPVQPSGAKFVLVVLADHADKAGYCYPGQELIAAKTGQAVRSVRAHLARLEADGWIARSKRRAKGKQTSDGYSLNFDRSPGTDSGGPQAENPAACEGVPQAANSAACEPESQAADSGVSGGEKRSLQAAKFAAEPLENHQEPSEAPPVVPPARYCGPRTGDALDAAVAVAEGAALAAAVQAWNRLAMEHGFAAVQRLDDGRRKRLRARLAECGGLAGWEAALAKVAASRHLHGHNRDGFRATFDFLTRPANFTQVMEGSYDDRNRGTPEPGAPGSTAGRGSGGAGRAGPQSAVQSALAGIRRAVDRD